MRWIVLMVVLPYCGFVRAEVGCSPAAKATSSASLRLAQGKALRFEASPMDSGVPAEVAPQLIQLKKALAEATDAELACEGIDENGVRIQARLRAFLRNAAPGMAIPKETKEDDDFKPIRGLFGNEVSAKVRLFGGPPLLLEVTLQSDVTCGKDSQLLIYEVRDGHWRRALRWTSDFGKGTGSGRGYAASGGAAWGDFFLISTMVPDAAHPERWRAVVAHGTPWCSSRFSVFGLAVLAPAENADARVVWQTERGFSRLDYEARLRGSGNEFELRLHADEMEFDRYNSFERLVVYRYRVQGDAVTRLEPVAGNARGFVEEWLSMPWDEALAQLDSGGENDIKPVHDRFDQDRADRSENAPEWLSGSVQACTAQGRFQVAMREERKHYVPGKPGDLATRVVDSQRRYYSQLREDSGYRLIRVTSAPDPACGGPDLMKKGDGR
jgi:hypothetical protein